MENNKNVTIVIRGKVLTTEDAQRMVAAIKELLAGVPDITITATANEAIETV